MPERNVQLAMHSIGTKLNKKDGVFVISGWCLYRFRDEKGREIDRDRIRVLIGESTTCGEIKFTGRSVSLLKGVRLGRYRIELAEAELMELDVQNKVQICLGQDTARIKYNVTDGGRGRYKTSRVYNTGDAACYLRQSAYNGLYVTVREQQLYDEAPVRRKVRAAWLLAGLWPKKGVIFMFEKECSRYEESASVLYEKLIDDGYTNAVYIINRDNPVIPELEAKYRKNLIYKDSFRHLLYYFKSRVFIGTEMMSHAVQLRASDRRIVRKAESSHVSYVFLQHGVSYMIPLDADFREPFRKRKLDLYKVVVSSEAEAEHFVQRGGFKESDLYITGFAKFDRSIRYEGADRIVIMPTWRRWEANQARHDFCETGYYKLIRKMFDAVPGRLREKVIILPHPHMQKSIKGTENELSKYIAAGSHDMTLRSCDLLITDYSSIAYDAYYRGSNVIFYWEEKDECLRHYGQDTELMLTEKEAFGDVCYNKEQLAESICRWYGCEQSSEHTEKYRRIVKFHDGRNTERIVEELKRDGIFE